MVPRSRSHHNHSTTPPPVLKIFSFLAANSMFDQAVPAVWQSKAYPSLKPLGAWYRDLLDRLGFMRGWVENGIPPVSTCQPDRLTTNFAAPSVSA